MIFQADISSSLAIISLTTETLSPQEGVWRRRRGRRSGAFTNMAPGDEVSLKNLAIRAFLKLLERGVEEAARRRQRDLGRGVVPDAHLKVREMLRVELPGILRQELLDRVLSSGRLYNTLDLLLLEALLQPDIRRICVRYVRKWYRAPFLQLLKDHGTGIETLALEEIQVGPTETDIDLARALTSFSNLRRVSLRFECDNSCLQSLGRSCPNLEEIDVEGSQGVTDLGVQTLCLRGAALPLDSSNSRELQPESGTVVETLYSALERCLCLPRDLTAASSAVAVVGLSWWRASLARRGARKNPCCTTLIFINVIATQVTLQGGVGLLKSCCSNAQVVHSNKKISEIIEAQP